SSFAKGSKEGLTFQADTPYRLGWSHDKTKISGPTLGLRTIRRTRCVRSARGLSEERMGSAIRSLWLACKVARRLGPCFINFLHVTLWLPKAQILIPRGAT